MYTSPSAPAAMYLNAMVNAYVECALWSSTDDDGEFLDTFHNADDVAPETLAQMRQECADFLALEWSYRPGNVPDGTPAETHTVREWLDVVRSTPVQAGHDFWLTRNGHGAGFWDRGYGYIGDVLTYAAKTYGSYDLYVGDNGKVYAQ